MPPDAPPPLDANASLPAAAAAAARAGRTVEAIRLVREADGSDLRMAKARVDAWIAADPALAKRIAERQKEFRKQLVGWVLVVDAIVLAALAAWWFSR
jgi:hypothetical protein